ncbi:tetratricopeptide repeat protein [Streptomyces sp. NPDC059517]|uniref:tetratricopeptide repeat protein n=1 Tax=Streptomyces sp. NPDC059517 TaxID=3346855 RepID=UPI0036788DB9
MNTGEQDGTGASGVRDDPNDSDDSPALAQLRARLNDALASSRTIDRKHLCARTGLGRTTVWKALTPGKPVPTAKTVAALAHALKVPGEILLALQREAAAGAGGRRPEAGRPITQWDPHALEVHPAGPGPVSPGDGAMGPRALPKYVERAHDRVLAEAVREATAGRSRILVLLGSSSTGKTRACWEAVQPLAEEGWLLWHPFDPTRAEAAHEDLHRIGPRTVVWLNDAQHYLGHRETGERIAAAVHDLLTQPERGPVLVLGTLWPEYDRQYAALPAPGEDDPHSRVRELLAGSTLSVPEFFDATALAEASAFADDGDRLLADALTRTRDSGRLAQDLAGAPELLKRYEHASPAARAILDAAMDALRLGVGPHLPQAFLTEAVCDYLTDDEYDQLTEDWAEQAYAELAEPVHGKQAPLRRTMPRSPRRVPTLTTEGTPTASPAGPMLRLADYLEQHGHTTRGSLCPSNSFWHAAYTHLTRPDDLDNLVEAAEDRHRLQWAHHLLHRAAHHGSISALKVLAVMREEAGDREEAEVLYRRAADLGNTDVLFHLAVLREEAGDQEGADEFVRQAADSGDTGVLRDLAELREEAGDREGAEALARLAVDHDSMGVLYGVALLREESGDEKGAEDLYEQAANQGSVDALYCLAVIREQKGAQENAECLYRQAADRGDRDAVRRVVLSRERMGDSKGAENLSRQAANHGDPNALYQLATTREQTGQGTSAEHLYREAADRGSGAAQYRLARMLERRGDSESAAKLYREAAEHNDCHALYRLAILREEAGDQEAAENLAQRAIDHGNAMALYNLGRLRERLGDREGAAKVYRQAAEGSRSDAEHRGGVPLKRPGDRDGSEERNRQVVGANLGAAESLRRLAQSLGRYTEDQVGVTERILQIISPNSGAAESLTCLGRLQEETGDHDGAEEVYRQAVEHGSSAAAYRLSQLFERKGDRVGAEKLARQAADHGNSDALYRLGRFREKAGDLEGAESLYRQAADRGHARDMSPVRSALSERWPDGLDADGQPTPAWR